MSATITAPFIEDQPPAWASGYGIDEYGYFAELNVPTGEHYWEFVTQRMRWIAPGSFLMGSPEDEPERYSDEGPQHEVTISSGFWLADTACTQQLWQAVTGNSPARFPGTELPVENVSHNDVLSFCEQLNKVVPGLWAGLPTEAQWEFACRCGTTTPFSFGATISTEEANFDGNYPYPDTAKGQYRKCTIEVKALPPNVLGLYQMHGNVREWCADWRGEYAAVPQTDPTGPDSGSYRVIRGGSWYNDARDVRSACRHWFVPGGRSVNLGFRLLSSASPAQPPNK